MNETEKEFYKDIINDLPDIIKDELLSLANIKADDFTRLVAAIKTIDIRNLLTQ